MQARDVKCVNLSLALHRGVISKEERLSIMSVCFPALVLLKSFTWVECHSCCFECHEGEIKLDWVLAVIK